MRISQAIEELTKLLEARGDKVLHEYVIDEYGTEEWKPIERFEYHIMADRVDII